MDGIPNINFYYVFTFFYFSFSFHDSGVGGGGRCHCPRFSPVDTAVIFVPRQYLDHPTSPPHNIFIFLSVAVVGGLIYHIRV